MRFPGYVSAVQLVLTFTGHPFSDGSVMLRPDVESAVRRVAEGMISPRVNKPPDKYSPHNGPTRWAVIGDSYSAGPGSGDPYGGDNGGGSCLRTTGAYGPLMEADFPIDTQNEFQFLACSGNKMPQVLNDQLPKISNDKEKRLDFAVMTIGGNDIEFSKIVRICVVGIKLHPLENCAAQLRKSYEIMESDQYYDDMTELYDKIFGKLDLDDPDYHYQLYILEYPVPIEEASDVKWCNEKRFSDECSSPFIPESPKLGSDLRYDMDKLVRDLNRRIRRIASDYSQRKQHPPGYKPPEPGWGLQRIFTLETVQFIEHKFCHRQMEDTKALDDPRVYFHPYCDRALGELEAEEDFMTLGQFDLDPSTCNTTDKYDSDIGYTWECDMSVAREYNPDLGNETMTMLPESWAKIFHPRPNGFREGYKKELFESVQWLRRPENHHDSAECEDWDYSENNPANNFTININAIPTNVTYQCAPPPNPDASQQMGSKKTKALSIVADIVKGDTEYPLPVDWLFFQTDYGTAVDCRPASDAAFKEPRTHDANLGDMTYASSVVNLTLFDENFQYRNDGDNGPGALYRDDGSPGPMGVYDGDVIDCKMDDAADYVDPYDARKNAGRHECEFDDVTKTRRPFYTCEW